MLIVLLQLVENKYKFRVGTITLEVFIFNYVHKTIVFFVKNTIKIVDYFVILKKSSTFATNLKLRIR